MTQVLCKTFSEWKSIVITEKDLNYQHTSTYIGSVQQYFLFAYDSPICYVCYIDEASTPSDFAEYEDNYAENANKNLEEIGVNVTVANTINAVIVSKPDDTRIIKSVSSFSSTTKSCNSSTWTEFYNIDFSPNEVYFHELIIKSDNAHLLQITIDSNTSITDLDIGTFESFIAPTGSNNHNTVSKFLGAVRHGNDYHLKFNLDGVKGSVLKIDQKRISGTGNLTLEGYILSYKEDI